MAAVAVLAAGCGGGGIESPATPRDGKTVFTEYCGACHTLSAAGADGGAGPNLDDLKPERETVAAQVRDGGGGMPAFSNKLSAAEIDAVADFVASTTR
ncbi:MAG: cytochrome c [Actinobacteria bacterium]|nr:cytochrome c [Actinomycetota bacterium]